MSAIIAVVSILAIGLLFWFYRHRQKSKQARVVSFVAFLKEPMSLDPAVLAKIAGRAWNADLGDGSSEGPDGFVSSVGPMNMVMHSETMFLVNCVPAPYMDDREAAAEANVDMRISKAIAEHEAWFSCDVLGCGHDVKGDELTDLYRRLGKLFTAFFDENFLLIYLPDQSEAYPINDETHDALLAENPIEALQATRSMPIISVADDDPLMLTAIAKAKSNWPQFVEAFETKSGTLHSIKAPISHSGNTEHIWIEVTALEGGVVYGKLANDTGNLGSLRLGSKVRVPLEDIQDWCYLTSNGTLEGCFTKSAVEAAARKKHK
jgi:uncharacterized protein YegJ (DUF2314 family)